jgi:PAS domain S-box-containing protein
MTKQQISEEMLRKRNNDLENRVQELLSDLTEKNDQLKMETAERRKAEEKLRANEEMYSSIFTHIGIGISMISPDMEIIFLNTVMKQINPHIDVSNRPLCYKSFNVPPRNEVCTYCPTIKTFHDGKVHVAVTDTPTEGGVIHFRVTSAPVPSADGSVSAVIEVVEDITEPIRAEEALRESEFFFKESQRAAFIGSYKANIITGFWESSEVLDQIFGIDMSYCRSIQGWLDIVHPEDSEMMKRYLREEVLSKRKPFNKEYRIIRKSDGEVRWVNGLGKVGFDAEGNIISLIGTIQDITERKQTEEALLKTQKLESLGILAGGIAHDFNNLLSGIFGYLEMARMSCEATSKTTFYLDKALKTFSRAKDLTQQLLTFSKGGAPIRKTASIAPLLKESAQFALSGSNVSSTFHIADKLWLCDFDENQMGQVVDNIVINAVQAMPLGGNLSVEAANIEVKDGEISSLRHGKYVHVSFTDTGIGIPPSIMPRIFDPFFTTKHKGNGLGLATVYSIVKKHDGEITVDSKSDRGTIFHLYLPVSGRDAVTQLITNADSHKGTGRILIMDDEESIREVVGDMLQMMGYTVEYALNGHDALRMIQDASDGNMPFLAAIMDMTIPGSMGGKEAVTQLRKTNKDLVVYVSSGYSDDPVMADPAEYGFTDKILKPFRIMELEELFIRHL